MIILGVYVNVWSISSAFIADVNMTELFPQPSAVSFPIRGRNRKVYGESRCVRDWWYYNKIVSGTG